MVENRDLWVVPDTWTHLDHVGAVWKSLAHCSIDLDSPESVRIKGNKQCKEMSQKAVYSPWRRFLLEKAAKAASEFDVD